MVREFLANPFGFTPHDPTPSNRGPNRPKNETASASKKAPAAEQASAAACLVEPTRKEVSSSLGENPPTRDQNPIVYAQSCDFSLLKSAAKAWPLALGSRADRNAFIDLCFNQPWALRWSPESRRDKIVRALNKTARIKIRARGACDFATAKRDTIFNIITVRKALEKELAGHGLKIARHFDSQQELHAAITELRESVNERHLARAGDTRINLWNDPESAAIRDSRALVSNARQIWEGIVDRTKVAQVNGRYLIGKSMSGQRISADLTTDLEFKPQECPALVFPTGLRVGDDPEGLRVLIIQERQGQPIYHIAEAKASSKDKRGFDERKPIFGEGKYVAAPDTQQDQLSKFRKQEIEIHRERVSALREGTTGEPVAARVFE